MPKIQSRENSVLKMRGAAGDGLKSLPMKNTNTPISTRHSERVAVPSSRKFTATSHHTPARDETLQLNLKKAIIELEASSDKKQKILKKSKSVAEITPTKSKVKKSSNDDSSRMVLHATPRPHIEETATLASRRDDEKRRLGRVLFNHMLVYTWRRSKERVAILSESLRRRQDQIINLEKQVDCLKDLNKSECEKRNDAINDYQKLEGAMEIIQAEKSELMEKNNKLQCQIEQMNEKVVELDKNLMNNCKILDEKTHLINNMEVDLSYLRNFVENRKQEENAIITKMNLQKEELCLKDKNIANLKEELTQLNNDLTNKQMMYETISNEINELMKTHEKEKDFNVSLNEKLEKVDSLKNSMKSKINKIELDFINITKEYERVFLENQKMKENIANFNLFRKYIWNKSLQFAQISWSILQNAAYIMLPAV